MTKDTNESKEEPSKNQEMKSMWSAQSAQSHWNPSVLMSSYVLMNVLMAHSKLKQNMSSRSGPGRNLPNGEWHCEPCMSCSDQLPARCILSISEYLFSLPTMSMANQELLAYLGKTDILWRWAKQARSWRSSWRNIFALILFTWFTCAFFSLLVKVRPHLSFSQVLKNMAAM